MVVRGWLGTPAQRFWRKVNKNGPNGCWLWTAGTVGGYGSFWVSPDEGLVRAHRYALMMKGIDIPDGIEVCHKCDVKSCVRPSHLFLGTHRENMIDAGRKGLLSHGGDFQRAKTHCKQGHSFAEHGASYTMTNGAPRRQCLACQRVSGRAYRNSPAGRAALKRRNERRRNGIGNFQAAKTHCKRGHAFAEHASLRTTAEGGLRRRCLTCARILNAAYRERRRNGTE